MSYFGNIWDDQDLIEVGWSESEIGRLRQAQREIERKKELKAQARRKHDAEMDASRRLEFTRRYNRLGVNGRLTYDRMCNNKTPEPMSRWDFQFSCLDIAEQCDKQGYAFTVEQTRRWWQFWKA